MNNSIKHITKEDIYLEGLIQARPCWMGKATALQLIHLLLGNPSTTMNIHKLRDDLLAHGWPKDGDRVFITELLDGELHGLLHRFQTHRSVADIEHHDEVDGDTTLEIHRWWRLYA